MSASLLPARSTAFERAFADANAEPDVVRQAIDLIPTTKTSPPPSLLPFLVYEYGLGELTPYVPNLYQLLREGILWQRVRGTPASIAMGLAWLGYSGVVEEEWAGRAFWNSMQLRFASLPRFDVPDLEQIEGVIDLSLPRRSKFRRGVFQYDVGALEADETELDNAIIDFESGIKATNGTLLFPEGAIWSFGRTWELPHVLTEAEGTAIGNWLEPVGDGATPWIEMSFPWINYVAAWAATPEEQRRSILAGWFAGKTIYAVLRGASGNIIGYRRCRAVHTVRLQAGGAFSFGTDRFDPRAGGGSVYIEAMTQFDDAKDVEAKQISLLVGASLSEGVPPGRLWLSPGALSGGNEIAAKPINVPLRKTVRDQFKFLLRF